MSYYWFNREEILQKAKEMHNNCGGREKSAEYYQANKGTGTEICQKNKKKQKKSSQKIGIKK